MSDYLPLHPLAKLFPPMAEADLAQLVDDIAANGQRETITTLDGQVIDGRNRQAACERLGLVADYEEFSGEDPLAFVLSRNLHRRHLTESQRAMVAASLVTMERGMNQHSAPADGGSANLQTREAARRLSISERAVAAARAIRRHGAPALIDAIRDGKVTVHAGEALKGLSDPEVHRLLSAGEKAVMETAKALRTEKLTERRATKLSLIAAIAEKGSAAVAGQGDGLAGQKFAIAYVDPPWEQRDVWSDETGQDKAYPYPTMTLDEICAFVAPLSRDHLTEDALLYLWRTANRVREGLAVMEAMGFAPVTEMVWDKVRPGTGRWVIDRHEVLMIGKRGAFPCLLPGTQPQSLYSEPKTEHSAKPAWYREMIDRLYPDLPKLELFGRGEAPAGWVFYGFEVEGDVLTVSAPAALPPDGAGDDARRAVALAPAAEGGSTPASDVVPGKIQLSWSQEFAGGRILLKFGKLDAGAIFPDDKGCTWSLWIGSFTGEHKKAKSIAAAKAAMLNKFADRTGFDLSSAAVVDETETETPAEGGKGKRPSRRVARAPAAQAEGRSRVREKP